jgi:hypothetical protein
MKIAAVFRSLIALGLVLGLAACARYPLGMSEAEWLSLSPQQQLEARAKQAEIDRAREAELAAERARREAAKEAERQRIAAVYRSARYGDIVECVLDGGIIDFHPGWKAYQPAAFTLVAGETREVKVTTGVPYETQEVWASLSETGTAISLCYSEPAPGSSNDCAVVSALSRELDRGIESAVNSKELFNGARLRCAYRPIGGQGWNQRNYRCDWRGWDDRWGRDRNGRRR